MTDSTSNYLTNQYLTTPGLGSSGAEHWQTLWEKNYPHRFKRVEQLNWDLPDCTEWVEKLQDRISKLDTEVVVVAHSLGCIMVAHWAARYTSPMVKGAFLVAPADAEECSRLNFVEGFSPISKVPFAFPSTVVASTNDPYCSFERATQFAYDWGSELVDVGEQGHINSLSGHGAWPEGLELLFRIDS
jgi:hypothetical protein